MSSEEGVAILTSSSSSLRTIDNKGAKKMPSRVSCPLLRFSLLTGVLLITQLAHTTRAGWIDPDSPLPVRHTVSFIDGAGHDLVFSDEFNVDGRSFKDGEDPKWTAIHKDDYTNDALQFYRHDLVTTTKGCLNITTIVEDIEFLVPVEEKKARERERRRKSEGEEESSRRTRRLSEEREERAVLESSGKMTKRTKNYQSAMIQGWNKFCFTGGIIEISAKLPGSHDIGGLWPAMWLLGNLARATYVGSSNNVWPWSYNTCDKSFQTQQRISACNIENHFDLPSKQGRGSPEIDILEAMAGIEKLFHTPVNRPYYSASLQVSPGVQNYRPTTGLPPDPAQWYHHHTWYGKNASQNIFFYGMHLEGATKEKSYFTDAISANRDLEKTHFANFHKYRLEWIKGDEGYIVWYLDDELVFRIDAPALNLTGAIIPDEPMYLIFNTAVSKTWGFPTPCPPGCPCDCFDCRRDECLCAIPPHMCENFPAHFLIDYVRVYQKKNSSQIVGCSTPTHPTKTFIAGHLPLYDAKGLPLAPVANGGGDCRSDVDCGPQGKCEKRKMSHRTKKECVCLSKDYTGSHCRAANGFDDIDWDPETPLAVHSFLLPSSLTFAVAVLAVALFAVVLYKFALSHTSGVLAKLLRVNVKGEKEYTPINDKEDEESETESEFYERRSYQQNRRT